MNNILHNYPEAAQKPKFRHDCSNCLYLGLYLDRNINSKMATLVDLYICPGKWPVPVARWSDHPKDYTSGLLEATIHRPGCGLSEALNRAAAYDLLGWPGSEIGQRRH
jgi:hypothetical protein